MLRTPFLVKGPVCFNASEKMEMSCPVTRIKFIKLQVNIFVIFLVRRKHTVNDLIDA